MKTKTTKPVAKGKAAAPEKRVAVQRAAKEAAKSDTPKDEKLPEPPADAKPDEVTASLGPLADTVGKFDVDKMDKASLRGALDDVKSMKIEGVKAFWKPDDDEATLRKRLSRALEAVQPRKALEAFANLDFTKLTDCKGVFIDLRNPTCVSCTVREECRGEYLRNMQAGFAQYKPVQKAEAKVNSEAKAKADAAKVKPEEVKQLEKVAEKAAKEKAPEKPASADPESSKALKAKKKPFVPTQPIFVIKYDKNPVPKSIDGGALRQVEAELLAKRPRTMAALREILGEHYEVDTDKQFWALWPSLTDEDTPLVKLKKLKPVSA